MADFIILVGMVFGPWIVMLSKKTTHPFMLDFTRNVVMLDKFMFMSRLLEVDSSAKGLLNVPLGDFDDLRVICGEDQATGVYGKSFADIPSESINIDDTSETHGKSAEPQSNSRRAKRSRPWDEAFGMIGGLTEQVARLTEAVVSSDEHADQNFCDKVYGELLAFEDEDFDDDFLTKAFEYLTSHSLTGRQFLAKHHIARLKWLKDFATLSI